VIRRLVVWVLYWTALLIVCMAVEVIAQLTLPAAVAPFIGVVAAAAVSLTGITFAPTRKGHRP
jgi:hypothetical protein